jgi:hypothetical protein
VKFLILLYWLVAGTGPQASNQAISQIRLPALLRWSIAAWQETGSVTTRAMTSVFSGFRFPPEVISMVWVPRISSTSCDQAVFVDHAADARVSSDTVLLKIDRFG